MRMLSLNHYYYFNLFIFIFSSAGGLLLTLDDLIADNSMFARSIVEMNNSIAGDLDLRRR